MIVRLTEVAGSVASTDVQLFLSTQDLVDVPLLEELYRKAPAAIKASIHCERHNDYVNANLYLSWPKEAK